MAIFDESSTVRSEMPRRRRRRVGRDPVTAALVQGEEKERGVIGRHRPVAQRENVYISRDDLTRSEPAYRKPAEDEIVAMIEGMGRRLIHRDLLSDATAADTRDPFEDEVEASLAVGEDDPILAALGRDTRPGEDPEKVPIDRQARIRLGEIWQDARKFYPGADEQMPEVRFPFAAADREATAWVDDDVVHWPMDVAERTAEEDVPGETLPLALHEWAHVYQDQPGMSQAEIEGGARAFEHQIHPQLREQFNVRPARWDEEGDYEKWADQVSMDEEHGLPWILSGQFEPGGDTRSGGRERDPVLRAMMQQQRRSTGSSRYPLR